MADAPDNHKVGDEMMSNIQGVLTIPLTDEDVEMLEAFHVADQNTRKHVLKMLKFTRPIGTPVADFLRSIDELRAQMTPDEIAAFRQNIEQDFNQIDEES